MRTAIIVFITGLFCSVLSAFGMCSDCTDLTQSGPTMLMDYGHGGQGNPVDTFMYFVPLVAPTTMDVYKDPNTTFNARITSKVSNENGSKFTTTCTFEITGQGIYEAFFDPREMIAFNLDGVKGPKTLHNLLRSIRVDGPMKGQIEVCGVIKDSQRQVNQFELKFNVEKKSTVTVHLYYVKYDGKSCSFDERFNEQVARIDSLRFTRGGNPPTMTTEIAAVAGETQNEGLLAAVKAMLANLFLPPLPIASVGNDTMMNFGTALDATESSFTFPYAQKLRQNISILLAKQDTLGQDSKQVQ